MTEKWVEKGKIVPYLAFFKLKSLFEGFSCAGKRAF